MANDKWYEERKGDAHSSVIGTYEQLIKQDNARLNAEDDHLRLYGNYDSVSTRFGSAKLRAAPFSRRSTWNIAEAVSDTLTAKVSKNKPRPEFVPAGGDFNLTNKAKLLNKFLYGQFQTTDIYALSRDTCRNATVFGTGILKVYPANGKIIVEQVMPSEITVDDLDGQDGDPQNLYQSRIVSKSKLKSRCAKHAKEIELAGFNTAHTQYVKDFDEQVSIYEAWHLSEKGGRHILCIDTCTLVDETWEPMRFPFAFLRYKKMPKCFWGRGVVEQLTGIQYRINDINLYISKCLKWATPWIIAQRGSIPKGHINNQIMNIMEVSQAAPQVIVPQVVSPELLRERDLLWNKGFEISGISQLSAASKKPAGLNSGVAIREAQDIETERFADFVQNWDELFMDLAKLFIMSAKQIAKTTGDYEVVVKGARFFERIPWSDIDLEEDQYELQSYPSNYLPSKPEARIEKVMEMRNGGLPIPDEQVMDLLELPDFERYQDLERAGRDVIREVVDNILATGVYIPPEPFDDHDFGRLYATKAYHKGQLDKAPEERLDLLRDYILACVEFIKLSQPPAPPGAPVNPA